MLLSVGAGHAREQITIAGMARSYMYEFRSEPLVYFAHIDTHAYPSCPNPPKTAPPPMNWPMI